MIKVGMKQWHTLDCEQVTNDNPTCRCMQLDHHIGVRMVANYIKESPGVQIKKYVDKVNDLMFREIMK